MTWQDLTQLPDPDRGALRPRRRTADDGRCDAVDRPTGRRCLRPVHRDSTHRYPAPAAFQDTHTARAPTEVRQPDEKYL